MARAQGLAAVTLREVATRVGMQAPSLYSHFASKNAIYDAMFGQAWQEYREIVEVLALPDSPRAALRVIGHGFLDFATTDVARYQLMNQRTLADFEPTPASYAPALAVWELLVATLRTLGIDDPVAADLFVALLGGLADSQLANDPGGNRWTRLLGRAIDMYANEMGLPGAPPKEIA
ncbi:MAG: hypothetical protein NVSMB29_04850 [Candidatus Dormibacteria bacterium]